MPTTTDTTDTPVTKVKLPLDRVFCQFECYQQTEKTVNGKTTQVFEYKPIHSYKLYLFYKKNDQFFRMPGNTPSAEPIVTVDDHAEYIIPEGDIGKCNYAFKKDATYYGYFAGKNLTEAEISGLMGERSYVLLKMIPSRSGILRIQQSLFWWLCLLQKLEESLSALELLNRANTLYNGGANDTNTDTELALYQHNSIFISNMKYFQMKNIVTSLKAYINNDELIWEQKLGRTIDIAINLHNNSSTTTYEKCYAPDGIWNKVKSEQYGFIMPQSHIAGAALGNVISVNINSPSFSLVNLLEDFFYNHNDVNKIENFLKAKYLEF